MDQATARRIESLETEVERLKQKVQHLEWMLETPEPAPTAEMTAQQWALHRVLEKHGRASTEMLLAAMRWSGEPLSDARNTLKTQICAMRAKGISIATHRGWGYELIRRVAPVAE